MSLLLLLCFLSNGLAADPIAKPRILYVAPTGSDANAGSRAAPFQTIQHAANVATAGTTVYVEPGIYKESVVTKVQGAASARVRYVSNTKWGAKVVGVSPEAAWTNNGSYTDIVGFDISGPSRLGILNYASFTYIAGNHVHDIALTEKCGSSGGAGITNANYTGSDGDIIGNVVHDIGVPGACNGVHGIYSSNLRGRINNNIVFRVSAFGIHLWHAANKVTIANNTVFANGAGNIGGGIIIGSGDVPGGVVLDHTKVINNIVFNNQGAGIREYCYPGKNCTGPNNTIANNLVYGNGSAILLRTGSASGTISADPKFVAYRADGTGNYHLRRSSPAVNKGTSTFAPSIDIDNVGRKRGGAPDLGAYENY